MIFAGRSARWSSIFARTDLVSTVHVGQLKTVVARIDAFWRAMFGTIDSCRWRAIFADAIFGFASQRCSIEVETLVCITRSALLIAIVFTSLQTVGWDSVRAATHVEITICFVVVQKETVLTRSAFRISVNVARRSARWSSIYARTDLVNTSRVVQLKTVVARIGAFG